MKDLVTDNKEILVSIACLTFNHEDYIRHAIESFLMQKTKFKFEILIHDDASTDNTPQIIKSYAEKYPNIIRTILQTENQYSQGNNKILPNFICPSLKGRYIALCEGDDYWTDPHKLQKQIDYLELHPESSLCVHAATTVDHNGNEKVHKIRPNIGNRIYTVKDIILIGGGKFPTNSMMYRAEFVKTYPNFYYIAPVGDYPLQIYLSLQGTVYYIDECMSSYRVNAKGSWTNRIQKSDTRTIELYKELINMFVDLNFYTKGKLSNEIEQAILSQKLFIALITNDKKSIKEIGKNINFKYLQRNIKFGLYMPTTYFILRKLRTYIRKMRLRNK